MGNGSISLANCRRDYMGGAEGLSLCQVPSRLPEHATVTHLLTLSLHIGLKGLAYQNTGLLLAKFEFPMNNTWFIRTSVFHVLWDILTLTNYFFIGTLNVTEYSAFFSGSPTPASPLFLGFSPAKEHIHKATLSITLSRTCFNLSGDLADQWAGRAFSFFLWAQELRILPSLSRESLSKATSSSYKLRFIFFQSVFFTVRCSVSA